MKKSVAAYWVFALSLVLVTLTMHAEAEAQILDRSLSLRELARQLQTPDDIAHFLWRNFLFENDQSQFGTEEHWQTPEEFLMNRRGDCEDFAIFAREILRLHGTTAFLLNIYGGHFSHTVCVFREDGRYSVLDGTEVRRYNTEDLKDIASRLYPYWKWGAIVAPSAHSKRGRIVTEFERKLQADRRIATSA